MSINRSLHRIAQEGVIQTLEEKDREIEKLKEDLEYSDHCEQQMRKTITNLEYKITTLEEEIKELKQRLEVEIDISDGMLKTIDKAIEYIEKNWISQKDADNYRFDDAELIIEISDIADLFNILDKGE